MTSMNMLGSLTTNLLVLAAFVAVLLVALRVAQSIFGTGSKSSAATEAAARLVAYPTASPGVLRRRFVKAVTSQHVVMPSGDRVAFSDLVVRISPEDLERLDPDGDTDRLGDDAAKLYRTHAEREGWTVPSQVVVEVEIDPGLRSGWVPPARGRRTATPARRPLEPVRTTDAPDGPDGADGGLDWDVLADPTSGPASQETMAFPVLVADDPSPTVNVAGDLYLHRGGETVRVPRDGVTTLGRLPECPLALDEPEISYRHAAIRLQGATWQVMDVGSTNGTTVDGERIDDTWVPLRDGVVLGLAGVRVTVGSDTHGTVALGGVSRAT